MPATAGEKSPSSRTYGDNMSEAHSVTESIMSAMNKTEAKKWDEWDRRDSQSAMTNEHTDASEYDTSRFTDAYTVGTESQFTPVSIRQSQAHKKLIKYTKSAITASSQSSYDESGTRGSVTGTSASGTSGFDSSSLMSQIDGNYEVDEKPGNANLHSPSSRSEKPPVHNSIPSALSLNQRRILLKFCSTLKNQGIEVLKQNRDSKWQVRYLTTSKELQAIKDSTADSLEGEIESCPIAVLWVKRFSAKSTYSTSLINRQGRGGVMIAHLTKVAAAGRSEPAAQLPKKYQEKYKDSVIVLLEYNLGETTRSMAVRCRTTAEAHFLCTGMRVCMDVLKREHDTSEATINP
jgi:hypothetical protein